MPKLEPISHQIIKNTTLSVDIINLIIEYIIEPFILREYDGIDNIIIMNYGHLLYYYNCDKNKLYKQQIINLIGKQIANIKGFGHRLFILTTCGYMYRIEKFLHNMEKKTIEVKRWNVRKDNKTVLVKDFAFTSSSLFQVNVYLLIDG